MRCAVRIVFGAILLLVSLTYLHIAIFIKENEGKFTYGEGVCWTPGGDCFYCASREEGSEKIVTECNGTFYPGHGEDEGSLQCRTFRMLNRTRQKAGVPPLEYDGDLATIAHLHALDMAHCRYVDHYSQTGISFLERCSRSNFEGECTGENLAAGYDTPKEVMEAWLQSPGHRKNLLSRTHKKIGIGVVEVDGRSRAYWSQNFGGGSPPGGLEDSE